MQFRLTHFNTTDFLRAALFTMTTPLAATASISVAPMQPPSQGDITLRDLRTRLGEDVSLLSYLPCQKVRKAPFNNRNENSHPLPVRILFGKVEHYKSTAREIWALLHNKPGSSRPPEVRLRYFSRQGEPEEPIRLEEASEQASPTAAFACVKAQNGFFDRPQLSAVLRYYFISQKIDLPSPWPISDIFVTDLKSACRAAKLNAERKVPQPVSLEAISNPRPRPGVAYTRSPQPVMPELNAGFRLGSTMCQG